MSDIDFQFHFRNFHQGEIKICCNHYGCLILDDVHDNRVCCWKEKIGYGPMGQASNDVYCPANFVVRFGDWWPLIKDGLKLIASVGLLVVPPTTSKELKRALENTFGLGADIIKEVLEDDQMTDAELNELAENADASFLKTCNDTGMNPDRVKEIASQMGMVEGDWFLLAGRDYWDNIHGTGQGGSPIVGDHGWSIFRGPDGDRRIATACFINQGHFIFPVSWKDDIDDYFWTDGSDKGGWNCPY